ncbi:CBS domain-containing protein [Candidatus Woesearchaeota archaeon]|nr:CBS domain-containing protein [Candidatus Woesearchaeota archaeon]
MLAKDILRKDFVKVDKEDTVSQLIGRLRKSKKTEAVVLSGKKYYGIVCKRKLIKSRIKSDEEKVKRVAINTAVLNGGESVEHVAALMNSSDVHMLPVVRKGILDGVVYAIDIISYLDSHSKERRVSEFVKGMVTAFHENTEVGKVLNIMRLNKIDHAPIVNEQSKLIGIVSIIDLLLKYSIFPAKRAGGNNIRGSKSSPGKDRDLGSLPISNECTYDVVTLEQNSRIKSVISLMEEHKISDVVIINDFNEPVGIITIKDILKLF